MDQSVSLGANVTFSVRAYSTNLPISYRWIFGTMTLSTNSSLVLSNITLMAAGGYSVITSDSSGSVTSRVATLTIDPTFTKITIGSIGTDLDRGWGCAWGDYDNDGFIDLVVGTGGPNFPRHCLLYHNKGDGTFAKITNTAITSISQVWNATTWGDYDNDGFLDLFLTSDDNNKFYRNLGGGSFAQVTVPSDNGRAVGWADYDQDGFLDLVVGDYF
jgi:hypothetical protein